MIDSYGGLVLGIAALNGLLLGSEFFVMETSVMRGVARLRDIAFSRVLSQDKSCFDRPELTQVVVMMRTSLMAMCDLRNKRSRDEVARVYYEFLTVRGIRHHSCNVCSSGSIRQGTSQCFSTGVRGAFVEGCSYGVASALIYLAERFLVYVGAVLIAKGTYTYLQMCQVLNLLVFTDSVGSQLMSFTQRIAKSVLGTNETKWV
ncbi:uncharacterized protein EDB91DRAFT_1255953 [Suillus paluster]|uniref:uncharacterized protein n=1 Tax=Suillus paluster TaxID=48578 RepID=UPI001B87A0B3|nr:uncharacterized protein EDB91DRAFT_1255953 [Suillus paluster]KAG1722693.1 hypothetical protein EDB91DRAFT_1255953 [Suillus paluster]